MKRKPRNHPLQICQPREKETGLCSYPSNMRGGKVEGGPQTKKNGVYKNEKQKKKKGGGGIESKH